MLVNQKLSFIRNMGILKRIIEMCTEPVDTANDSKSILERILERIYEVCTEPVKDENQIEEDSQEIDLSFADSKKANQIYESIKGKIQVKRRELKVIGESLLSIDLNKFPKNKQDLIIEIIESHEELCKSLETIINQQETVDRKDATEPRDIKDTMDVLNLESSYAKFEKEYQEKIILINNLYWLSELKKQNKKMKLDFRKMSLKSLNSDKIENYRIYIQAISDQREDFTYKLGDELIDELITAEYRLNMLMLMRDVNNGEEVQTNPFESKNDAKKEKYEQLFLQDIEEANRRYEELQRKRKKYITLGELEKKDFKKIEKLAEQIKDGIDLAMVDDLSISEVFTSDGFDTIKQFVRLRLKMNSMIVKAKKVDDKFYIANEDNDIDY